ncbi:MAG TPA: cupin domain-containing protein [Gammaproteobacteria bacterium]|jgi:mannose-6-phosphate isomerase-like protein (cupin superfamily)|nr:cupin domain-containing protein [Gammaproteobacteria bacterium]
MRTVAVCVVSILFAAPALAQQAAPAASRTMVSASEVQAMIAKAKADRKDNQALVAQSLIQLAPYNVSLEYRASVGGAAVHETEAELFYVVDGSATLVTGGKLTEEKRTNAENLSGTGIQGGQSRKVAKGDFVIVPNGTPHWFSAIDGTVVLMSLHLPRKPAP